MQVIYTGYSIEKKKIVKLFGNKVEDFQAFDQSREDWKDREPYTFTWEFDVSAVPNFTYLRNYLKKKACTKDAKTWGEALRSLVGVTMQSPRGIYLVHDWE